MTSRIEPISITHPELVEEWDYDKNGDLLPEQITCSSSIKIHWKCKHGHEWIATPRSRTSVVHTGCPHCEHRVATPGEYLLLTEYPELAAEWDYDKNPENVAPDNILPNDRNKYWWKCSNGHSFENSPHGRISRHVAPDYVKCPYCSHHIVSPGEYSFATEYPELLNEWDWDKNAQIGLDPDNILPASGKDAHWKCDMGHTWVTTPAQRAQAPNCPYCEHWIATPGEYSILTEFPELALEWDYKKNPPDITPDDILPGTHKKYWWKCKNGHSFERSPYARPAARHLNMCVVLIVLIILQLLANTALQQNTLTC